MLWCCGTSWTSNSGRIGKEKRDVHSRWIEDYFFQSESNFYAKILSFWLLQNIDDIRNCRRTKVPVFDLETGVRSAFKELEVSEDCGVVCKETVSHLLASISKLWPTKKTLCNGVYSVQHIYSSARFSSLFW